jgi:uncharacterized protein (TIGR02246 family)
LGIIYNEQQIRFSERNIFMEKRNVGFSINTLINIFLVFITVGFLFLGALVSKGIEGVKTNQIVVIMQGDAMRKYEQIAIENFVRWNEALQSHDAKKVAELYSSEATFLPTLSPKFMNGNEEAEEYFKRFLKKNPMGKVVKEKVQVLSSTSYLHSGLYNFQIDEAEGKHIIEARFTFLWTLDEQGIWKIAHHHSSIKPKE